jgi:hypothetical protein
MAKDFMFIYNIEISTKSFKLLINNENIIDRLIEYDEGNFNSFYCR